jgi:Ca-activated chloride channel family protein
VLRAFRSATDPTVHTFGIDTAVNAALLRRLARQQEGECWLLTPHDDIAGAVAGLGARLRRPVVTQLRIGRGWELAGEPRRSLHAGQVLEISLCAKAAKPGAIRIEGTLADGEVHPFQLAPRPSTNAALPLLWARERIARLQTQEQQGEAHSRSQKSTTFCATARRSSHGMRQSRCGWRCARFTSRVWSASRKKKMSSCCGV